MYVYVYIYVCLCFYYSPHYYCYCCTRCRFLSILLLLLLPILNVFGFRPSLPLSLSLSICDTYSLFYTNTHLLVSFSQVLFACRFNTVLLQWVGMLKVLECFVTNTSTSHVQKYTMHVKQRVECEQKKASAIQIMAVLIGTQNSICMVNVYHLSLQKLFVLYVNAMHVVKKDSKRDSKMVFPYQFSPFLLKQTKTH